MKFSIIIPMYNSQKTIKRTLDSIAQQVYKDYEIILVDDGSQDKTFSICEEVKSKNKLIRLFRKENEGPGAARNYGLERATGDYICFVDADDYVKETMLKDYCSILGTNHVDILFNGHIEVDKQKDKMKETVLLPENEGLFNKVEFRSHYNQFEVVNINSLFNKVYNRDFLSRFSITFPPKRFGEDAVFNFEAFTNVETVYLNKNAYYYYDKSTEASIVKSYSANRFQEDCFMMQQYEKMFAAWGAKKMYRTNIMHKYWNVVLNALRNINHKNANLSLREKKRQMKTVLNYPHIQLMFDTLTVKEIDKPFQKFLWTLLKKNYISVTILIMQLYVKIKY